MSRLAGRLLLAYLLTAWVVPPAHAQIDARMLRYPDVSSTHIAFVYAGDIWIVPKAGGVASRLSSPPGEESFPRFSPDGTRLAFSANYDGNQDVYVVPSMGGDPVRVTHHPMTDRVVDWHPDGARVLFASSRESGRQRFNQFFLVSADGGLPERLPVPYGEYAAFSPDGSELAYLPKSQANRTWKRYRGGWTADVWRFDLTSFAATNLTGNPANDEFPMWHDRTIYFLSDRGPQQRYNIWAFDTVSGRTRQVTRFTDFDVTTPALGPREIVFQAGGGLYLLDLRTEKTRAVAVQVITDRLTLKPRTERVASLIRSASVSPSGKRAAFEARGEIFTVPAEHGPVLNLTRTSGVAERYPRWSPDGRTLAFWSDRTGEYELTLRPAEAAGAETTLTSLGAGFRYAPFWSPDSERLAFVDEAMRIRIVDRATGTVSEVDRSPLWMNHGSLENLTFRWSADSRWLTWARPLDSGNRGVFLYDTTTGIRHQVTSGYFNDSHPVFDPGGSYLYYLSDRNFEPVYSDFDNSWTYPNATRIVAVPLRPEVPSPLAARNDVEVENGEGHSRTKKGDGDSIEIALDGFEGRAVVLPPRAGNYRALHALKGRVLYHRAPRSGSGNKRQPVIWFDLGSRYERLVLEDADHVEPTADGRGLLVELRNQYAVIDLKPGMKFEHAMRTAEMETTVDPPAEWRQMFADAYRLERDYFYDPALHGVDWEALRDRYAMLLDDAVTRWDVNFVLGEFIGELNASHTYRGGGDEERAPARGIGMLGVDWELTDGAYRIRRIVRGGPWDTDVRSPLDQPGLQVAEGDYVLAVNGVPLDVTKDPWAAFAGLANETVVLTVNEAPVLDGSREVTVQCLNSETDLRFREWVEQRRARVEEATGGRVGYIYVQSTSVEAQNELVRQFMAQWRKEGLIIDERFNSGGQIPDRFIELLNRPLLSYWASRHGESRQWPPVAHNGPKVMLINGWSGSGGDAFPFYFRAAGLGPLVGTRTWGGLIGISGAPGLVDGGQLTVPTFRMYDVQGEWFAEGHGVEPDIEVPEDPSELAQGIDPQLERAIAEAMNGLRQHTAAPPRPAHEERVPPELTSRSAGRP